jgi:tetratricopeptide (TPR) repeat protein
MAEKSSTPPSADRPSRAALPLRRKLLYAALLTAVFFVLLVATLELALRLFSYGHSPHFARREKLSDGSVIWRENRDCTAPFFSEKLVRRPQPFRLAGKKPAGVIRIFVLGSSAAMGDPESSFSIARLLEAQLRAAYPDKKFEVINAAITAINSHLVRGIADDCAQLEPDLFIVYEGHNEIIGPFGPAGVFTDFLRNESALRFALWLKGTRTGQLIASLTQRDLPDRWGGLEMFLDRQLRADDPRLDTVRALFRANLLAVADSAKHAGASTLVCTVLANQRDFAPFLSLHRSDLSPADLTRWEKHFSTAESATRAGNFAAAEEAYLAALAIDDQHAELHFRLGRLALQAARNDDARRHLQRALDLDTLRFRTDSALNQVVRDLASSPPSPTAALPNPATSSTPALNLVDLDRAISARSSHGIPGDDLLYEHVHLNFRGAYECARELLPAIVADLTRRGRLPSPQSSPSAHPPARDLPAPLSLEEARLRLAFTLHEQTLIWLILEDRFRHPPFSTQSDAAFRQQSAAARLKTATAALARDDAIPTLRAIYGQAIAHAPDDWVLQRDTGMMLLNRGAPADAVPFLEKAAAWIDDDADTLIALGRAYRAVGRNPDADRVFAAVRRIEPFHPNLPQP